MEDMLEQLNVHEHNIAVCSQVDTFWYLQKIEEITLMQNQVEEARVRFKALQLQLHTESHKIYHRVKSDALIIKRNNKERKTKRGDLNKTVKSMYQQ